MTRRRWIADRWDGSSAVLLGAQAAHLAKVLRAQIGQVFDIVVGDAVRRGVIEQIRDDAVQFSLHERVEAAESLPLHIALGIIRFERMEWAIEKLTELGVVRIVPLRSERSEKHLVQAAPKRVERWRRIALEAAQQSRRSDVPEISDTVPLADWATEDSDCLRLFLSEQERVRSLRDWLETMLTPTMLFAKGPPKILAAVGPEGGWTEKELTIFSAKGWQSITLGPRILRAETAAIALASALNAWLES